MSKEDDAASFHSIKPHRGWLGQFTRYHIPGALPSGTRVVKAEYGKDDITPAGTLGTVLGSTHYPAGGFGYFIEWDDKPKCAVFTIGSKIRALH